MARHKRNPPNEVVLNRRNAIKCKHKKSVYDIAVPVCKYFNITLEHIQRNTRKREVVEPRQIISYFAKYKTELKLQKIGDYFGQPHHQIIHSVKAVENLIDTDKGFAEMINQIEKRL